MFTKSKHLSSVAEEAVCGAVQVPLVAHELHSCSDGAGVVVLALLLQRLEFTRTTGWGGWEAYESNRCRDACVCVALNLSEK